MLKTEVFVLLFPLVGQILEVITEYLLSKVQPSSREETYISIIIKLVLGFYIGIASYKIYTFGNIVVGTILSIFVGLYGILIAIINCYLAEFKRK